MNITDLLKQYLPGLAPVLINQLGKLLGRTRLVDLQTSVQRAYARFWTKTVDFSLNAAVRVLTPADSETFRAKQVADIRAKMTRIGDAAEAYSVAQLAVAQAQEDHGEDSPEAVAARAVRKPLKDELERIL